MIRVGPTSVGPEILLEIGLPARLKSGLLILTKPFEVTTPQSSMSHRCLRGEEFAIGSRSPIVGLLGHQPTAINHLRFQEPSEIGKSRSQIPQSRRVSPGEGEVVLEGMTAVPAEAS